MTEYPCILSDPPWPLNGGGKIKRGADRWYPTINNRAQIAAVHLDCPLWNPAPDAHLWMWTTNNHLPWALWIMNALDFRYVTNFPWVKPGRMGLGQYARGCHELLLFGVRGKGYNACTSFNGKRLTVRSDALVGAPRPTRNGKVVHSAKPVESYELIERRSIGPRLELFARGRRNGWDCWGNEIEKNLRAEK